MANKVDTKTIEQAYIENKAVQVFFENHDLTCEVTGLVNHISIDEYFVVEAGSKFYLIMFDSLISADFV